MNKKTRTIILVICFLLFVAIIPYVLLYSVGDRVDFKKLKIVGTGGIYVRALPQPVNVLIDSKIGNTTNIFSNAVFVQNLLPDLHSVLITKPGYYDYQKTLEVTEKSVTKLEHIILFKNNISFDVVADPLKSPFITETPKDPYVVKNSVAQKITEANIIYLGQDGFLYSYNVADTTTQHLSQVALKINKKSSYEILVFNKNIFLKENTNLLLLDQATKTFVDFYAPVTDVKLSPDGQKILYFNDKQLVLSSLVSGDLELPKLANVNLLDNVSGKITDAYWLNDDYIILLAGNNIMISEIDIRNNVNTVTLPQNLTLSGGAIIPLSDAKISFNQQEKRLYVSTQDQVLVSERLVP